MAGRNDLRPFHVLVAGAAVVLFLFWLAVHVVAYCEPQVPLDEMYAIYLPFDWLHPTLLLPAQGFLGIWLARLYPNHPRNRLPYYIMAVFFVVYFLYCVSQCRGQVRHDAAGWIGFGKHGGAPLTEEQAFHAMWSSIKASSVFSLAFTFATSCVLVGSCLRTWRQSRSRQAGPGGEILNDNPAQRPAENNGGEETASGPPGEG